MLSVDQVYVMLLCEKPGWLGERRGGDEDPPLRPVMDVDHAKEFLNICGANTLPWRIALTLNDHILTLRRERC